MLALVIKLEPAANNNLTNVSEPSRENLQTTSRCGGYSGPPDHNIVHLDGIIRAKIVQISKVYAGRMTEDLTNGI